MSCKAGVELRGETGNPRGVVLDAGGQFSVISSVDGGGTVASLTVTNGYAYANSVTGAGIHTGRMVNFSDAKKVISNCVITCCIYTKDPEAGQGNSGAALVLDTNSLAIDCLVSCCTNSSDATSGGGGLYLRPNGIGANVVVRNSLFVGNENSTKSAWTLYVGANTVQSPLRNAGLTLDWMVGAYDLQRDAEGQAFRDHIVGAAVDIGCFEYAPMGGLLFLVR